MATVLPPEMAAVTVTVFADVPSAIRRLDWSTSITNFWPAELESWSFSVMGCDWTVSPVAVPDTMIVSLPSVTLSCLGVRVKVPVPLVWPARMVMSKSDTVS